VNFETQKAPESDQRSPASKEVRIGGVSSSRHRGNSRCPILFPGTYRFRFMPWVSSSAELCQLAYKDLRKNVSTLLYIRLGDLRNYR
jgi:hypothetical protein